MGILLLSSNQPQRALTLVEDARCVPIQSKKICSWHAAIEAETYSYLGNIAACKKALERAKDTSEETFSHGKIPGELRFSHMAPEVDSCKKPPIRASARSGNTGIFL